MGIDQNIAEQGHMNICTFWLAERLFGVNILDVKEVGSDIKLTPIFHANEKVSGYVNIRGNINLIIDLRKVMNCEAREINSSSRIILFKEKIGESFGVLVDKIGDVVNIDSSKIEYRKKGDGLVEGSDKKSDFELGLGVYKLEKGLIFLLNSKSFLSAIRE